MNTLIVVWIELALLLCDVIIINFDEI